MFGQRRLLGPDHRRALRAAGLGHLVAVSGLHVGIVAGLVVALALRIPGAGTPARAHLVALPPVAAFAILTGGAPPAVRAAATVGVLVLCLYGGIFPSRVGVVTFVAAALAVCVPRWTLDPGYQMSVAAALALATAPPGSGMLAGTWRITWTLAPLCAYHFGDVPLAGVVANLVAIPLFAGWVLPLGFAGGLLAPWWDGPFDLAASGAAAILDLARPWAALPPLGGAGAAAVAGAALLLARGARLRWLRPPALAVAGLVAVAGAGARQEVRPPAWAAEGRRSPVVVARTPRGPCVHGAVRVPSALASAAALPAVRGGTLPACTPADLDAAGVPPVDVLRRWVRRCGRRVRFLRAGPLGVECFRGGRWRRLRPPGGTSRTHERSVL